ncbi:MAG TPA: OB-fold nucleic acid binding domain-containing protein, partial [Longimicrobiales bacterium]|nr:OB-fold nucleic acid binding domain-containing protein [Longimicrobiales bacterium]
MPPVVEVKDLGAHAGREVTVLGWVEGTRTHGKVAFLDLRDGTGLVQGVVVQKQVGEEVWAIHQALTQETAAAVTGEVRDEPRAPGGYELGVASIRVVGPSGEYPIQPKGHGVEFLLDHRHLWLRSSQQRAGLRVRHEVEQAIHDFFYERGFTRIDTPILTGAIGEHAGTLFETDYFG